MPMTGRIVTAFSLIALVLGLAACGSDGSTTTAATETTETTTTFDTDTTFTTTTSTTPDETTKLRVYFLLDGKVQPVAREVPKQLAVASAALDQLYGGPTAGERELGLRSDLQDSVFHLVIRNGVLDLGTSDSVPQEALAQIVYTMTQFPTVRAVKAGGKLYTRPDFEDETPAILVESPLAFETVSNPIRATGTANTFEATFNYELVDPAGKVVDKNFVTATSGSGQRGTFDFTTKPYTGKAGEGALVVF
jgi:Immunoglobulin-like domain of bacterial spore germination/Sporulation and spore germination